MASSIPSAAPRIAVQQGGVFTAEQARAEGWTARTIRRRIVNRRWVYVVGRALAEPCPRWSPFQLAVAAQLSMRDVVISHRTAAGLHGSPEPDLGPDEALPVCDVIIRIHRQPGVRIRAHRLHLEEHDVQVGPCGLWITAPARTAVDCLAAFPFGPALDLWAWVATRQILDREQLLAAIDGRRHWRGTQQLKRIAALVANGAVSHAEFRLHEFLRRARLTGWAANVPVLDDQA